MRIYTSSFWVCGWSPRAVAISRQVPQFYKGKAYLKLAPSWALLQRYKKRVGEAGVQVANAEFNEAYRQVLARLDARLVVSELGDGAVLCCWERDAADVATPCHRTTVAQWITEQTGIQVSEIECHKPVQADMRPKRGRSAQLDLFPTE